MPLLANTGILVTEHWDARYLERGAARPKLVIPEMELVNEKSEMVDAHQSRHYKRITYAWQGENT